MDSQSGQPTRAPFAFGELGLLAVFVAVTMLVVTLLMFFFYRRLPFKANTILFVGLSDAGKTTIFAKLINPNNVWPTYKSIAENRFTEYLTRNGETRVLVDVPGVESLRKNLITKWLVNKNSKIRCIVFVVDSASFSTKCKDAAEFLYDIFHESHCRICILVACNKQDNLLKAMTSKNISVLLEKELGLINVSRSTSLSSTSGDAAPRLLTKSGANFHWAELGKRNGRPLVSFVECSAEEEGKRTIISSGDGNENSEKLISKMSLDAVRKWIDTV